MSGVQALKSIAKKELTKEEYAKLPLKDRVEYAILSRRDEISALIPKHLNAERMLKIAQLAVSQNKTLLECTSKSLIGALIQCSQLGLEPNTVMGHAYLIPFWDSKKKERIVQLIIGYRGLIDLARRSGQIVSINAHEVRENDRFELVYGIEEKLNHTPAMNNRGDVIGFYAVAKLRDGGYCFEFMPREDVDAIMLSTYDKGTKGPWKDHYVEMGRKTVIRRIAKYLPISIEFQTAVALDGMAEAGKIQNLDIDGVFTVMPDDAPIIDETVNQETGEVTQGNKTPSPLTFAKVADQINKAKTPDDLDLAADDIRRVPGEKFQSELRGMYEEAKARLEGEVK